MASSVQQWPACLRARKPLHACLLGSVVLSEQVLWAEQLCPCECLSTADCLQPCRINLAQTQIVVVCTCISHTSSRHWSSSLQDIRCSDILYGTALR